MSRCSKSVTSSAQYLNCEGPSRAIKQTDRLSVRHVVVIRAMYGEHRFRDRRDVGAEIERLNLSHQSGTDAIVTKRHVLAGSGRGEILLREQLIE